MSTHCSIFAWEILCTEESDGLQSGSRRESDMTEHAHTRACTHTHTHTHTLSMMSLLLKKTHQVSSHARGSIPRDKPWCEVLNKTVSPNQLQINHLTNFMVTKGRFSGTINVTIYQGNIFNNLDEMNKFIGKYNLINLSLQKILKIYANYHE